jgi:hypothetical protein
MSDETILGTYAPSGAALLYRRGSLEMTGLGAISYDHVRALDAAHSIAWTTADVRAWFYSEDVAAVFGAAPSSPPPPRGSVRLAAKGRELASWAKAHKIRTAVVLVLLLVALVAISTAITYAPLGGAYWSDGTLDMEFRSGFPSGRFVLWYPDHSGVFDTGSASVSGNQITLYSEGSTTWRGTYRWEIVGDTLSLSDGERSPHKFRRVPFGSQQ